MDELLNRIQIQVNSSLYTKDPLSSELGKNILRESSIMISEIGFDSFTFKKLGKELNTNESSIYRYFVNKHNLLIYLLSWYWGYIEYLITFSCSNIKNPIKKLELSIDTLCTPIIIPSNNTFIDEKSLNNIVIEESSKTYLTKSVDEENKEGFFYAFKAPCFKLAQIIKEVNPDYIYPHSLASTVVEGIISQKYFNMHLSSLTDFDYTHNGINKFYKDLVIKTITT